MRKFPISSLLAATAMLASADSHAFKWQDYRQSENVIDVREETKIVSAQVNLEAGRRYLVAMIMLAENDASLHAECMALSQEIGKLKALKTTIEGLGPEPVRLLICKEQYSGSNLNLCAKAYSADSAPSPDLKKFGEELAQAYGPVMDQIEQTRASLKTKEEALAKESEDCRVGLQLILAKTMEVQDSYDTLERMIRDQAKPRP